MFTLNLNYSNLKVLITGSSGFVGSETAKLLTEKNISVVPFDVMNGGCDIRNINTIEKAVQDSGCNRILHLAATARFSEADKDPVLAYETNAWGTRNVALIAAKYHIPVVYSSTGSVYMPIEQEPPITEEFLARGNSVYACSKMLGEKYLQRYVMPWIILRYAHLYGKEKRYHGLIGGFLSRLNLGLQPVLYGGAQSNDFAYVKDVAEANFLALTASWDKWNQIYNIGTGEEITAEDAGKLVCKIMEYKGKIKRETMRTVDPLRFVYDCSKAQRMLGFKSKFTFEQGLKDMLKEVK